MASVGPSASDPVGGESEPPTGVRMIIGGYDVHFPFKPYASQLVRYTSRCASPLLRPVRIVGTPRAFLSPSR